MNRKRAGALLCLMLTCCMAGSSAGQQITSNAPPLSDAEQQVLKVEDAWVAAEHNRDAAALRRILNDKFVASFGAGKPSAKKLSSSRSPTALLTLRIPKR